MINELSPQQRAAERAYGAAVRAQERIDSWAQEFGPPPPELLLNLARTWAAVAAQFPLAEPTEAPRWMRIKGEFVRSDEAELISHLTGARDISPDEAERLRADFLAAQGARANLRQTAVPVPPRPDETVVIPFNGEPLCYCTHGATYGHVRTGGCL